MFAPGGPRSREKVHMVEAAEDFVVPPGGGPGIATGNGFIIALGSNTRP
jgi:hypothetical protein